MRGVVLALALVASPALAHEGHHHPPKPPEGKIKQAKPKEERSDDCLKVEDKGLRLSYCGDFRIEVRKTFRF